MGFVSHRPLRVPLLNARLRAARLAWAREHRDWSVEDWKRVAWSDESQFRLLNADGRLIIWGQVHEAMDPACQVGTVQGHRGSIMVWDVFSWHCFGSFDACTILPQCNSVVKLLGVITSIHLCYSVIRTVMEFSSKTTVPFTNSGWLLAGWMNIPLTFLP
ncbi:HTH_Tnp_Tc3_2 domain-containing protein [Trichonephila clavipes]|nr:HTH_Tnp_Tc3_2 domain-containing protein [Trichonephila clavipes]